MELSTKIQSKLLSRERRPGDYDVYRAGLEWDLVDPIVIDSKDDIKSGDRWAGRIEPFWHQVTNLITFCRRLPVTLLADDVGLGKTISAGLIVSELAARERLSNFLVVCPKILGPQWKEELETKFGIPSIVVSGAALAKTEPPEGGAVITTYDSARLHLEKLPVDRFQLMILDEAHKLRNLFGVEKPPQVAVKMRQALEERRFRYVLMLTATPIQNRLWDLYSLVDLLSVARGHQNPFGSPGMFERKFILDSATARQLRPEMREEFQSVVYGYMSRVRRGDAKLYFPSRQVYLNPIRPSTGELALIEAIREPIQKLNRLTQIGILKALVSSPEALARQLENMHHNGTIPPGLSATVTDIVRNMPTAAKLLGLGKLISTLRDANPANLRVVVFTTRRETQTTIEAYLSSQGLKVGIINGQTGGTNQQTIARFKASPPQIDVIVSTEAGSEGVNLQAANILVNYDLPWNPMIVEQRIGRVQRLGSEHEHVLIYNTVLAGTFEDYIVGRLMEKLQMASQAIGDLESLLQASGMDDDDQDVEDKVLDLVLKSLAGKDIKRDVELKVASVTAAKEELERERQNIDQLFGGSANDGLQGPRSPSLPPIERSMTSSEFVVEAYRMLGSEVGALTADSCTVTSSGQRETIFFSKEAKGEQRGKLMAAGTPDFNRLVDAIVRGGLHRVDDLDVDARRQAESVARQWAAQYGGTPKSIEITSVDRMFEGLTLVRVRASVKHDSFERLLDVSCPPYQVRSSPGAHWVGPIPGLMEKVDEVGIGLDELKEAARQDPAVAEFCRFYLERRDAEVRAAGADQHKASRLAEEFTPSLEMEVVGAEGTVRRAVQTKISYQLDYAHSYSSELSVDTVDGALYGAPELGRCSISGRTLPVDCLASCDVSGVTALRHLLTKSALSGRLALPEHAGMCSTTGRTLLRDELVTSDVTGAMIGRDVAATSDVSRRVAEESSTGKCSFTGAVALKLELARSEVSGRTYRADQQARSAHSGKTGHQSEFVECPVTRTIVAIEETEACEVTGQRVRVGVLTQCDETGRRAVPDQIGLCEETGKRVLRRLLVPSSVSGAALMQTSGIGSLSGDRCLTRESAECAWSGERTHPADIVKCSLTGLPVSVKHLKSADREIAALGDLLDGSRQGIAGENSWPLVAKLLSGATKIARCEVEGAVLSPDGRKIAVRAIARTLFGLRTSHIGAVFSVNEQEVVGRVVIGHATTKGWTRTT